MIWNLSKLVFGFKDGDSTESLSFSQFREECKLYYGMNNEGGMYYDYIHNIIDCITYNNNHIRYHHINWWCRVHCVIW